MQYRPEPQTGRGWAMPILAFSIAWLKTTSKFKARAISRKRPSSENVQEPGARRSMHTRMDRSVHKSCFGHVFRAYVLNFPGRLIDHPTLLSFLSVSISVVVRFLLFLLTFSFPGHLHARLISESVLCLGLNGRAEQLYTSCWERQNFAHIWLFATATVSFLEN